MVKIREEYSPKQELACSVLQGSLGGPSLYTVYASTMQSVVPEEIDLYGFADGLKSSFKASRRVAEKESVSSLESTLVNEKTWMDQNRLKVNDGKMEFIMFLPKKQLERCVTTSIDVNGTIVNCSPIIKYL